MSHSETEQAIIATTRVTIEDMDETALALELTDDELAMVAGGMKPVYIGKTYFPDTDSWESDWLPE